MPIIQCSSLALRLVANALRLRSGLSQTLFACASSLSQMPFACASGLLHATSPASFAFSTPIDLAL